MPSSSPVPRLMARSMLSLGMLFALASATAARRRGLPSGSPPPSRAAMVISLMMRVKTLPRFASAAPFLCLMVLHLLWPDMGDAPSLRGRDYSQMSPDFPLRAIFDDGECVVAESAEERMATFDTMDSTEPRAGVWIRDAQDRTVTLRMRGGWV